MKHKKIPLSLLFLGLGWSISHAQEAITASGGVASGTGGSASYSMGQVFYTNSNGAGGSVSTGVQQPFEISVVTEINEARGINLKVLAYPNPTTNYLTVTVEETMDYPFTAQLFDSNGKMVVSEKIIHQESKIDLRLLLQGVYFLKILQAEMEIKTFKIIKH
jgi:hypothetical protein